MHILPTTPTASEFIAAKRADLAARAERAAKRGRPLLVRFEEIGGGGQFAFAHEAASWKQQHNYPWKVFMLQRLRRVLLGTETESLHGTTAEGDIEYRLGYWIVGKKGRARGRWVWGQFCPMIPAQDLPALLATAIHEGTIRAADTAQLSGRAEP